MARYKATATITWEFDSTVSGTNPTEAAQGKLAEILANTSDVTSKVRVDRLRNKDTKIVWGEVHPNEVLDHIASGDARREYVINKRTHLVRMNSHRYFIFAASRKCVACGLEGTKMLLEQHPNDKSPHFNLYAVEENELVMLTKDHVRAKAYGGEDRHSNYQTMCAICNNLKGSSNLSLAGIRELRELQKQVENEVSRKKMSEIVQKRKSQLELPQVWELTQEENLESPDSAALRADVLIVETEGDLVAISVYDSVSEAVSLACISHGTTIQPVGVEGNLLVVPFGDRTFTIHRKFTNWKEQKCKAMNKNGQSKAS